MKLSCDNGHRLAGDNLSMQLDGHGHWFRTCRKCNSERAKRWRKANKHRLVRKTDDGRWPGQTLRAG